MVTHTLWASWDLPVQLGKNKVYSGQTSHWDSGQGIVCKATVDSEPKIGKCNGDCDSQSRLRGKLANRLGLARLMLLTSAKWHENMHDQHLLSTKYRESVRIVAVLTWQGSAMEMEDQQSALGVVRTTPRIHTVQPETYSAGIARRSGTLMLWAILEWMS